MINNPNTHKIKASKKLDSSNYSYYEVDTTLVKYAVDSYFKKSKGSGLDHSYDKAQVVDMVSEYLKKDNRDTIFINKAIRSLSLSGDINKQAIRAYYLVACIRYFSSSTLTPTTDSISQVVDDIKSIQPLLSIESYDLIEVKNILNNILAQSNMHFNYPNATNYPISSKCSSNYDIDLFEALDSLIAKHTDKTKLDSLVVSMFDYILNIIFPNSASNISYSKNNSLYRIPPTYFHNVDINSSSDGSTVSCNVTRIAEDDFVFNVGYLNPIGTTIDYYNLLYVYSVKQSDGNYKEIHRSFNSLFYFSKVPSGVVCKIDIYNIYGALGNKETPPAKLLVGSKEVTLSSYEYVAYSEYKLSSGYVLEEDSVHMSINVIDGKYYPAGSTIATVPTDISFTYNGSSVASSDDYNAIIPVSNTVNISSSNISYSGQLLFDLTRDKPMFDVSSLYLKQSLLEHGTESIYDLNVWFEPFSNKTIQYRCKASYIDSNNNEVFCYVSPLQYENHFYIRDLLFPSVEYTINIEAYDCNLNSIGSIQPYKAINPVSLDEYMEYFKDYKPPFLLQSSTNIYSINSTSFRTYSKNTLVGDIKATVIDKAQFDVINYFEKKDDKLFNIVNIVKPKLLISNNKNLNKPLHTSYMLESNLSTGFRYFDFFSKKPLSPFIYTDSNIVLFDNKYTVSYNLSVYSGFQSSSYTVSTKSKDVSIVNSLSNFKETQRDLVIPDGKLTFSVVGDSVYMNIDSSFHSLNKDKIILVRYSVSGIHRFVYVYLHDNNTNISNSKYLLLSKPSNLDINISAVMLNVEFNRLSNVVEYFIPLSASNPKVFSPTDSNVLRDKVKLSSTLNFSKSKEYTITSILDSDSIAFLNEKLDNGLFRKNLYSSILVEVSSAPIENMPIPEYFNSLLFGLTDTSGVVSSQYRLSLYNLPDIVMDSNTFNSPHFNHTNEFLNKFSISFYLVGKDGVKHRLSSNLSLSHCNTSNTSIVPQDLSRCKLRYKKIKKTISYSFSRLPISSTDSLTDKFRVILPSDVSLYKDILPSSLLGYSKAGGAISPYLVANEIKKETISVYNFTTNRYSNTTTNVISTTPKIFKATKQDYSETATEELIPDYIELPAFVKGNAVYDSSTSYSIALYEASNIAGSNSDNLSYVYSTTISSVLKNSNNESYITVPLSDKVNLDIKKDYVVSIRAYKDDALHNIHEASIFYTGKIKFSTNPNQDTVSIADYRTQDINFSLLAPTLSSTLNKSPSISPCLKCSSEPTNAKYLTGSTIEYSYTDSNGHTAIMYKHCKVYVEQPQSRVPKLICFIDDKDYSKGDVNLAFSYNGKEYTKKMTYDSAGETYHCDLSLNDSLYYGFSNSDIVLKKIADFDFDTNIPFKFISYKPTKHKTILDKNHNLVTFLFNSPLKKVYPLSECASFSHYSIELIIDGKTISSVSNYTDISELLAFCFPFKNSLFKEATIVLYLYYNVFDYISKKQVREIFKYKAN